jgi:hypothetical protein
VDTASGSLDQLNRLGRSTPPLMSPGARNRRVALRVADGPPRSKPMFLLYLLYRPVIMAVMQGPVSAPATPML